MSDPNYPYGGQQYGQYPPQQQYGQQYPPQDQQYPPQQQYPAQGQNPPQQGYPQQQQYPSQPQYGDQYSQQSGGYGPPAQGGFQHGQSSGFYGDQSQQSYNPPGGDQRNYPTQSPGGQFPQQGAYNQSPYPGDPNAPYGAAGQPQYGSTDPNAAQEGDRGMMGALAGGTAGYLGGHKAGGHGFLGAVAGAFLGSKLEDKSKQKHSGQGKW